MDYTFCELRSKEVVNIADGKKIGHIVDMVFDVQKGIICGLVLPIKNGFFLRSNEDIYIPFKDILKIGEDVILVELFLQQKNKFGKKGYYCHESPKSVKECDSTD